MHRKSIFNPFDLKRIWSKRNWLKWTEFCFSVLPCIFSFLLTCWYSYESLLYYRQRLWFNVFVSKFNSFNNLLVLYRIWFIKDLGWGLKALQHYLPMSILIYKVSTGLLMSNFRKKICAGTFSIELHMYRKH